MPVHVYILFMKIKMLAFRSQERMHVTWQSLVNTGDCIMGFVFEQAHTQSLMKSLKYWRESKQPRSRLHLEVDEGAYIQSFCGTGRASHHVSHGGTVDVKQSLNTLT